MPSELFKTGITSISPGKILVKGYDIVELMGHRSFAEIVCLIFKGELPSEREGRLMDAILVSSVDHGITPPSAMAARTVMSTGNSLNAAVAGGILTIGESHGGAIEQCAHILQDWAFRGDAYDDLAGDLLKDLSARKMHMPGFGHRIHRIDPRAVRLFKLSDELRLSGKHQALAKAIEKAYKDMGKEYAINCDGAIAAIMSDMGYDWQLGRGIFIISRVVGLVAQAREEKMREKPMRTMGMRDYEYDGPQQRQLSY